MEPFGTADLDVAKRFYDAIDNPTARAVLDFLIDHPDEPHEGYVIADSLGLPRHQDVAAPPTATVRWRGRWGRVGPGRKPRRGTSCRPRRRHYSGGRGSRDLKLATSIL